MKTHKYTVMGDTARLTRKQEADLKQAFLHTTSLTEYEIEDGIIALDHVLRFAYNESTAHDQRESLSRELVHESDFKGRNPSELAHQRTSLFKKIRDIISPAHTQWHTTVLPAGNEHSRPLDHRICLLYSWTALATDKIFYISPVRQHDHNVSWQIMSANLLPDHYDSDDSDNKTYHGYHEYSDDSSQWSDHEGGSAYSSSDESSEDDQSS